MPFSSAQFVFDQSVPWKARVLRASLATTTGLIVLAMFGKQPRRGPALGHNCDIRLDGKIVAPVRREGEWVPEVIGTVESVRDNLRELADHCKLDDADREELFVELRKWIRKDYRARSEA